MSYTVRMTENELIEACLSENRLAQKILYDRYSSAMYTLAYRVTNNFELAQDVLQEAFIKVFKSLGQFRRESTLGAWIKTIVVRTALSKIRREPISVELDQNTTGNLIDWGNHLDVEYLEKAIQSLPAGYRAIFVLIEVEGYSHKEAADSLGISVGTSKSQLFYAKKRLREKITEILDV
jgi:RNA polymerase sigma-70 factor (ECF subfamily)